MVSVIGHNKTVFKSFISNRKEKCSFTRGIDEEQRGKKYSFIQSPQMHMKLTLMKQAIVFKKTCLGTTWH